MFGIRALLNSQGFGGYSGKFETQDFIRSQNYGVLFRSFDRIADLHEDML